MTRYDLIKLNVSLVKTMLSNGIETRDVQYIPMYEEYREMKKMHHKVGYIICFLAEKYHMSERGIYKVIGRFKERVQL